MALHDIDKEKGDRANPKLNTEDNVSNRMAHKTIGTTYKTAGNPDTNRLIFDKGSIKGFDQDENNNIFIGYNPALSSRPIVRIAKDGFDVTTGSGDDLIFNSDQDVFKIVGTGLHTVTKAANSQAQADVIDISEFNLTQPPLVLGSILQGGFYLALPYHFIDESGTTNGGKVGMSCRVFATSSSALEVELRTPNYVGNGFYTSQMVIDFRYYILQETAATS